MTDTPEKAKVKSYLDFRSDAFISPMMDKQTEAFIKADLAEEHFAGQGKLKAFGFMDPALNGNPEQMVRELSDHFAFQVFRSKIVHYAPKTEVTVWTTLFLLQLCRSPADIVMWVYTLHRIYQKHPQLITLGVISELFPVGFPNEKGRKAAWDEQKDHGRHVGIGDNMVDRAENWL